VNGIVTKRTLTPNVKLFEVEAPAVARKTKPGPVIIRIHEKGERIPITIAEAEPHHPSDYRELGDKQRNTVIVDEETDRTSIEGFYASGDVVRGAATVISAMGAGKLATRAILEYMRTKKVLK